MIESLGTETLKESVEKVSNTVGLSENIDIAKSQKRKRDYNIDLVKFIALLGVISVHFFLNADYNWTPITDDNAGLAFMANIIRMASSVCVPLFLMATGYLMKNKELSLKYYAGLIKIVVVYLVIAISAVLFRIYYLGDVWYADLEHAVLSVTDFWSDGYAWYVEMFLGLFLIIPFPNAAYKKLGRLGRLMLIATLIVLVGFPSVVNVKHVYMVDWWGHRLYPILYYFLGSYLRDYRSRKKKVTLGAMFAGWCVLCAAFNVWWCVNETGGTYGWPVYNDWPSLQNIVASWLMFSLLMKVPIGKAPDTVKKVVAKVSGWTLAAYLGSWMLDQAVYPVLCENIGGFYDMLPWYLPVTAGFFVASCVVGGIVFEICMLVAKPLTNVAAKGLGRLQEWAEPKLRGKIVLGDEDVCDGGATGDDELCEEPKQKLPKAYERYDSI